jgi:predicted RNA binding protein YcfA (HicA-like mRNA interferase family)
LPRLPVVTGRELVAALLRHGYGVRWQSGSHVVMGKEGANPLSVPVHSGQTIPRGTLRAILKQAGLTIEQFIRLLK